MPSTTEKPDNGRTVRSVVLRVLLAILVGTSTITYIIALLLGYIPPERKLDTVSLLLVVISIVVIFMLLQPGLIRRLKIFEVGGVKIEVLQEVQERQAEQAQRIDQFSALLPLLIPETEQSHLRNLSAMSASTYTGGSRMRAELRRLRSIGLIQMHPGREVREIQSGAPVDIAEYVELTELGKDWVKRIEAYHQSIDSDTT
jgi:hypothetical protein